MSELWRPNQDQLLNTPRATAQSTENFLLHSPRQRGWDWPFLGPGETSFRIRTRLPQCFRPGCSTKYHVQAEGPFQEVTAQRALSLPLLPPLPRPAPQTRLRSTELLSQADLKLKTTITQRAGLDST